MKVTIQMSESGGTYGERHLLLEKEVPWISAPNPDAMSQHVVAGLYPDGSRAGIDLTFRRAFWDTDGTITVEYSNLDLGDEYDQILELFLLDGFTEIGER